MQDLHLVFGGELVTPERDEFKDPSDLHVVGVFPTREAGREAWAEWAQKTVDNAHMRYFLVPLGDRVGSGATDLCTALGLGVTQWDMAETAHGGPFPEVLEHEIFLNCILAQPGTPVFVPASACTDPRTLRVIGDIACDPDSDFSPIKVYDRTTSWDEPALRVHDDPVLDVTAIDNLPSLLPVESSEDFAEQLLPTLMTLGDLDSGAWGRAFAVFETHVKEGAQ